RFPPQKNPLSNWKRGFILNLYSVLSPQHSVLRDSLRTAQVWTQRFRDYHASVGLLIIFQDGDQHARVRQARTVQCMHELGFLAIIGGLLNVRPPRLEGLVV